MKNIRDHMLSLFVLMLFLTVHSTSVSPKDTLLFQSEKPLGSGYFGENVPRGMSLSTVFGEYRYFLNDSKMVYVPEGPFIRGDNAFPNSQPLRKITLSKYYIDKYEVTVAQFKQFCYATETSLPEQPQGSEDNHPIVNVTWEEANAYAEWVGKSLPTEAQWEKAARGGDMIPQWGVLQKPVFLGENPLPIRSYTWGNSLPNVGNYRCNYRADDNYATRGKDGYEEVAPIGMYSDHEGFAYGCHDLCGNVREWCSDYYQGNYGNESENPQGPKSGYKRVIRGGAWDMNAKSCRIGNRSFGSPDYRSPSLGFRLVKNLE